MGMIAAKNPNKTSELNTLSQRGIGLMYTLM